MPRARPSNHAVPKNQTSGSASPFISASSSKASSIPSKTSGLLRSPRRPPVFFGPSELLEEPGSLVKPLQCLVGRHDLLAQRLVTLRTKSHVLADEFVLLDELAHLDVGEPQVVPGDGGVLDATGVEDAAAGGA